MHRTTKNQKNQRYLILSLNSLSSSLLQAMIPDDKKESMNKTWDSMNEAAETAVKNIKEYYSSTRVGKATIDAGTCDVRKGARQWGQEGSDERITQLQQSKKKWKDCPAI